MPSSSYPDSPAQATLLASQLLGPGLPRPAPPDPAASAQPLWKNDLVTAQYLDVPSSGYGRTAAPAQQQPQQPYMQRPGPYPVVGGHAAAPSGVAGPFQRPYGNGGPGPQLYVVQPTGVVVPAWEQQQPQQVPQLQQHQQSYGVGKPAWKVSPGGAVRCL